MKLSEFLKWMEDACDPDSRGDASALMTARALVRYHDRVVGLAVSEEVGVNEMVVEIAETFNEAWYFENILSEEA